MPLPRKPLDLSSEPPTFAGESREVTILFSDLEGFTALTEQIPPREVVGFLNRYFTAMADPLAAHGGRIDAYMGDAMLVVWDGTDPVQDARNAAKAALAMLERMETLQLERLAEGKRPVKVRIGLSSGSAIVGEIGSPRFRQWTVIGDVVNTASRLEALNKQFHTDILLSEATYTLIRPWAEVEALGPVTLKGRREPLECYALLNWRDA
ncbi:Adenylate cyclase 1 [compost metagenome]